jgi:hypothetical protein
VPAPGLVTESVAEAMALLALSSVVICQTTSVLLTAEQLRERRGVSVEIRSYRAPSAVSFNSCPETDRNRK